MIDSAAAVFIAERYLASVEFRRDERRRSNSPCTGRSLAATAPARQLRHFLTLKGLSQELLADILDDAGKYLTAPGDPPARSQTLAGRTVANLFFEPSTRTRASFDLAARRLGADVLNLDVNTSSRKKGESILDTIYTLEAMQVDVMVVRDASAGVPAYIARHLLPTRQHTECWRVRCVAPDSGASWTY